MADKLHIFVQVLAKRTSEGRIPWERTVNDGVYEAAFSDYTVRVFTRNSREGSDQSDIVINILDVDGQIIDEIDDETLAGAWRSGKAYQLLSEMYKLARRRALGVEHALDSLLWQLGDDAPPEAPVLGDDDVPF